MIAKQSTQKLHKQIAIISGLRTPFAKQSTDYKEIPRLNLGKWL